MRRDFPNLRGTLSAPVSKTSRTIAFDQNTENLLADLLEGQWTYLILKNDFNESEVVKVYVELGVRKLLRGVEFTRPAEFQVGDTVEYVFTAEHADYTVPSFSLGVSGALFGQLELDYQLPSFEHVGAAKTVASGDDIYLGRNNQAYGCCDGGGAGAVAIEPPYIYLTSKMYPYFIMEPGITGYSQYVYSIMWETPKDAIRSVEVQYIEATIWGGRIEYALRPEDALRAVEVAYFEATIWGGAISFAQRPEDALESKIVVYYEAVLTGSSIKFNQYPEDALTGSVGYIEGSLT